MVDVETVLKAAAKSGALIRYEVALEQGELEERRLWLRPEVADLLTSGKLDDAQVRVVRAALRRFVLGGRFTVVTAAGGHREVDSVGDIRELKGDPPPFVELRFKPPKHHLRLFGRFVGRDNLVLTTYGLKSLTGKTGKMPPSIPAERSRCDAALKASNLKIGWVVATIEDSISKTEFI
jgi:hypothetical protein